MEDLVVVVVVVVIGIGIAVRAGSRSMRGMSAVSDIVLRMGNLHSCM